MKFWNNDKITAFKDETGVIFRRGPFDVDGQTYDYMIDSDDGEDDVDYCTVKQMEDWDVVMIRIVESTEPMVWRAE